MSKPRSSPLDDRDHYYMHMSGSHAYSHPPNAEANYSSNDGNEHFLLTPLEMTRLRSFLNEATATDGVGMTKSYSTDSDYPHFHHSTHAWAVFADDPRKSATWRDRIVGVVIIAFQLYTYSVFSAEAIDDYRAGRVPVMIRHVNCQAANQEPYANFECQAQYTNNRDAFCAFFMLAVFLSGDMIQAIRVLWDAPTLLSKFFASLAFLEVLGAFGAACLAVSYNLYIGEVTDAIEVGVGLLFIRELSSKTYAGIRNGKQRQYHQYVTCLMILILIGMITDPLCELWLANQ